MIEGVTIQNFDKKFIEWARRWFNPLARTALFIIFFYFGLLKLLGLSPAEGLAATLVTKTVGAAYFHQLFFVLSVFECLIGILFLIPKATRIVIFLMLVHMAIVCSPLALAPEAVWSAPFVPNLDGQYVIKNVALIVLAIGLVAQTKPLKTKN